MYSSLMHVMTNAARKASRALLRDFGEVEQLRYSIKGSGEFVSAADLRAEEILCQELQTARADFDVLAEERGIVKSKITTSAIRRNHTMPAKKWIIDPLDGTRNFIHGFPFFAISLAVQMGDEITAGLIYAPLSDELFTAEKGEGAFLNNQRIRVSSRDEIKHSLFAYGRMGAYREKMIHVMEQGGHIRQLGSVALALAYVASARLDGFLTSNAKLWDVAAGLLIIREAGGLVSALDGTMFKLDHSPMTMLASTASLHQKLL